MVAISVPPGASRTTLGTTGREQRITGGLASPSGDMGITELGDPPTREPEIQIHGFSTQNFGLAFECFGEIQINVEGIARN